MNIPESPDFEIRRVAVASLKVNPENPRTISDERLEDLKESLRADPEMLSVRPVIATPDGTVVAGNMRLVAAREVGLETIPAIVVSLTKERARLWMLKDNQSYGEWADPDVSALLAELLDDGVDLGLTGFSSADIDLLLDEVSSSDDDHDVDALPDAGEPVTRPGDLWALGEHRILCGDATDVNSFARLLENEKANLVWTDPPYGVDYEGKTSAALKLANDALSPAAQESFLYNAFANAIDFSTPGAVVYVMAPSSPPHLLPFLGALGRLDLWQQMLVWVKDAFTLGHSDFQYRHELLLYGWTPGNHRRPPARSHDTVWEFPRPKASPDHPTQKPVALIERAVKLSSRRGDIVLDPFIGSGSTLVAAHRVQRRCLGIELEPRYVDVSLRRFAELTGESPTRIARGES